MVQAVQCGFHQVAEWKIDVRKLHGKSLLPLIRGESEKVRDIAVSAFPLHYRTPRNSKASIRDGEWTLMYSGRVVDPAMEKPVPEVECGHAPGDYRVGDHGAMLFNAKDDPGQIRNLIEDPARVPPEQRAVQHRRGGGYVGEAPEW